jgi:hypothetical protein
VPSWKKKVRISAAFAARYVDGSRTGQAAGSAATVSIQSTSLTVAAPLGILSPHAAAVPVVRTTGAGRYAYAAAGGRATRIGI